MIRIELFDDYFIDVDEYNHTLKQNYIGKNKKEEHIQCERILGYFPSVYACIEKLIKTDVLKELDDKTVSLKEYALQCEKSFNKAYTEFGKGWKDE